MNRGPRLTEPLPATGGKSSSAGALLTAEQVAAKLAVPTSWVYAEARAGRIPYVPLGRYKRFREAAIDAWLEARERGAPGISPGAAGREAA